MESILVQLHSLVRDVMQAALRLLLLHFFRRHPHLRRRRLGRLCARRSPLRRPHDLHGGGSRLHFDLLQRLLRLFFLLLLFCGVHRRDDDADADRKPQQGREHLKQFIHARRLLSEWTSWRYALPFSRLAADEVDAG